MTITSVTMSYITSLTVLSEDIGQGGVQQQDKKGCPTSEPYVSHKLVDPCKVMIIFHKTRYKIITKDKLSFSHPSLNFTMIKTLVISENAHLVYSKLTFYLDACFNSHQLLNVRKHNEFSYRIQECV